MDDSQIVRAVYPKASCFGPVNLYWPGQGNRRKMIVTTAPHMSKSIGEGDTEEEAWAAARKYVETTQKP